jgi:hypothetical protein
MKTAEQLKNGVEQELRWEPSVHAEQIGVSVKNGVVEPDGHVGSFYEKWGAERAARRVADVELIASEISVDLSSPDALTDESDWMRSHRVSIYESPEVAPCRSKRGVVL